MSGKYNSLQQRIKALVPSAYYVWCNSHKLNLVLRDCGEVNAETKLFFGTLDNLYSFFTGSHKRYAILERNLTIVGCSLKLKRNFEIRFSAKVSCVMAVRNGFQGRSNGLIDYCIIRSNLMLWMRGPYALLLYFIL